MPLGRLALAAFFSGRRDFGGCEPLRPMMSPARLRAPEDFFAAATLRRVLRFTAIGPPWDDSLCEVVSLSEGSLQDDAHNQGPQDAPQRRPTATPAVTAASGRFSRVSCGDGWPSWLNGDGSGSAAGACDSASGDSAAECRPSRPDVPCRTRRRQVRSNSCPVLFRRRVLQAEWDEVSNATTSALVAVFSCLAEP